MSSHKSHFLRMEHTQMEWEAMASWWVTMSKCQLESSLRESQDRAVEATEERVAELLTVEQETAA